VSIQNQPPCDAIEIWERAISRWQVAAKSGKIDKQEWVEIASQLTLAVQKAGVAHFPRAHAHLAAVLLELDREADAAREANIALQQDPNEFRAQTVRVDILGRKLKIRDVGLGDFVHFERGSGSDFGSQVATSVIGSILVSAIKTVFTGIEVGMAVHSQGNFKSEIERLAAIYLNVCQTNTDVDEFMYMSETLISLGDAIREVPIPGGRPNLYASVVHAPVHKLNQRGREAQVREVKQRAEGRMLLFKK